jgi:hypothetical protein
MVGRRTGVIGWGVQGLINLTRQSKSKLDRLKVSIVERDVLTRTTSPEGAE